MCGLIVPFLWKFWSSVLAGFWQDQIPTVHAADIAQRLFPKAFFNFPRPNTSFSNF